MTCFVNFRPINNRHIDYRPELYAADPPRIFTNHSAPIVQIVLPTYEDAVKESQSTPPPAYTIN